MKFITHPVLTTIILCSSSAFAQDETKDTSGTNPTVLMAGFTLTNEYAELPNSNYLNSTTLKAIQPFMDGSMNLILEVPFLTTDALGGESGIGDLALKWNWVASVDREDGWVPSAKLFMPTGDNFFTSDQWAFAPGITYARFLSPEFILAPAYVHTFSFAGDDSRPDLHAGAFDLYLLWKPKGKDWWLTADLTLGINYKDTDQTPMSFELQCGKQLGKLGPAAVNGFIRPGIGIGDDRLYDWNAEIGVSIIGF